MPGSQRRLVETARRNRIELVNAKLSRRDLTKLGVLTCAGYLAAKLGLSTRAPGSGGRPASPPTTPWLEELPVPPVARPVDPGELGVAPAPETFAALAPAGRHAHAVRPDLSSMDVYVIENRVSSVRWHRELPLDSCWCFDGTFPGPRIHARYGRPVLVRFKNALPGLEEHRGYGLPRTSVHLDTAHTQAESDGDPLEAVEPGGWKDHLYMNRCAGF